MTAFDLVSAAFAVVAAALALWATIRAGPGPVGARHLVRGGLLAVAAALGVVVLGPVLGIGPFGAIRILYLTGVVSIPLAAAVVLAARARGALQWTRPASVLACAAVAPAALGVWMSFVEPRRLRVETAAVVVPVERAGKSDVTIGVLADLQCNSVGDYERAAVDRLLAAQPDVILIPGDLMQATDAEWDEHERALTELLARLDAPGGVWFVLGDVDHMRTLRMLRNTKVRVLMDEVTRVRVRDRDVTIAGDSGTRGGGVARELLAAPDADDVRILLVHRPDAVLDLPPSSRIDLTVAGHTHGGQVVIPGFGPPMTLSRVPRAVAAGGLHTVAGNRIYVSRGAGMERLQAPAMRLFCPPEVSVLTVTTAPRAAE